jgi:hypothetical protein
MSNPGSLSVACSGSRGEQARPRLGARTLWAESKRGMIPALARTGSRYAAPANDCQSSALCRSAARVGRNSVAHSAFCPHRAPAISLVASCPMPWVDTARWPTRWLDRTERQLATVEAECATLFRPTLAAGPPRATLVKDGQRPPRSGAAASLTSASTVAR